MVFTGIVRLVTASMWSSTGSILSIDIDYSDVEQSRFWEGAEEGESIAVDGCCLTLLESPVKRGVAKFFVQKETLNCTTLGMRADCSKAMCNVERALRASDRFSGHIVLGHVHGVGEVESVEEQKDGSKDLWIKLPLAEGSSVIEHKGSITLDGTSLTIAQVNGSRIRVSLIPYTLGHTTLGTWIPGRKVNVEFDLEEEGSASSLHLRRAGGIKAAEADLDDEAWMLQAIACGEKGRATAPPNPWVGCVIVMNGIMVGKGYHARAGEPHAEVSAVVDALQSRYPEISCEESLNILKEFDMARQEGRADHPLLMLRGATAYVTLEPCVGFKGKRTPPCSNVLIQLGFSRVVVALEDPDDRVKGRGVSALRDAGIEVEVGVGAKDATRSLRPYIKQRRTGLPHVVVKVACSLDGAVAAEDSTSKWITGPEARQHAHKHLRATSDAIVIGSETAIRDLPRLTVRGVPGFTRDGDADDKGKQMGGRAAPLRVVVDSRGRVTEGPVLEGPEPTLIITSSGAPEESHKRWAAADNVEVVELPAEGSGRVHARDVLQLLGDRGMFQVLIEGGATLQNSFFRAKLVDRLAVYVGGCLLGASAITWTRERLTKTMTEVGETERWAVENLSALGEDVFMEFVPKETAAAEAQKEGTEAAASRRRVARAVESLRSGGIVLVMDDKSRENEGDLVAAASLVTPDQVALMVRHTTGIICAPMPATHAQRLGLPPMVTINEDDKGTAFTVSCDVEGSGTGVSAESRCMTLRALASGDTMAGQLKRPGHVFPLVAREGGVHQRPGHTEASVALCQLAKISPPVAVIGELVMDSGRMARAGDVMVFAKEHGDLPVLTVEDLRRVIPSPPVATPASPSCVIPVTREGEYMGEWTCRIYVAESSPAKRARKSFGNIITLTYGHVGSSSVPPELEAKTKGKTENTGKKEMVRMPPPLCRVHSECFTADVIGSQRCDCRVQLSSAMREIKKEGRGLILYVVGHEGRGIGLPSKLAAYALMEHKPIDTYAANIELGFEEDERSFEGAAAVLRALDVISVRLLSNNPGKEAALRSAGIRVSERVPLPVELPEAATAYFEAKVVKMGHDASRVTQSRSSSATKEVNSAVPALPSAAVLFNNPRKSAPGARMPPGPSLVEAAALRITIVRTAWNYQMVDQLVEETAARLSERGVTEAGIQVQTVPGAWELPLAVQRASAKSDAVIAIGVLIKGDTMHFEYISESVSRGLMDIQLKTGVPVIYGVLNACTEEQAIVRANPKSGLAAGWADSALCMV